MATREELQEARDKRAEKYGISPKEGGALTPPKGYPTSEADYGDPTNYAWPADAAHARPALGYFNHADARSKGGYASSEWETIGKRLAKLVSRHLSADYEYKKGKLQQKEEGRKKKSLDRDMLLWFQGVPVLRKR